MYMYEGVKKKIVNSNFEYETETSTLIIYNVKTYITTVIIKY